MRARQGTSCAHDVRRTIIRRDHELLSAGLEDIVAFLRSAERPPMRCLTCLEGHRRLQNINQEIKCPTIHENIRMPHFKTLFARERFFKVNRFDDIVWLALQLVTQSSRRVRAGNNSGPTLM